MRLWKRTSADHGQATVEALAVVPFVVAAAIGLGAAGLWFRQTVTAEAAVASGAIALLEAPDPTDPAVARRSVGGNTSFTLKRARSVVELNISQRGWRFAGVSADRDAKLRWVEGAQ